MLFVIDSWMLKSPDNAFLTTYINSIGHEYLVLNLIPMSKGEVQLSSEHHPSHPALQNPSVLKSYLKRPDVFFWGRSSIKELAKEMGWNPGYYDENLNMDSLFSTYPSYCLNETHITVKVGQLTQFNQPGDWHIRPVSDDKLFAGSLGSAESIRRWASAIVALSEDKDCYSTVDANTPVVISPYQHIHTEYRVFIVDGQIVTGSLYMQEHRLCTAPSLPDTIYQFVQTLLKIGRPSDTFVMDIAQTHAGSLKVIEFNSLSGAGLYKAEQYPLVKALAEWTELLQKR